MKKLLIIVLLMFIAQLQAQVRIGSKEAYATAECFIKLQDETDSHPLTLSEEIKSKQSGLTNLFMFTMEPKGYVIVSALNEVLAYSFESTFSASAELPDHIAYWIDLFNEQTDYLFEHPEQSRKISKSQKSVEPLLSSIWGQGHFYNEDCPYDASGPYQHVSAGCVAIAMAQIMYYHKQPLQGCGTMSYLCSPYGTLSANFGNTTYRWNEMADTLQNSNSAVAQLISHCGISVKMQYGPQLSLASNTNALNAFLQFFSYPTSILSNRCKCRDEEWLSMIMENLDKHCPVYYTGVSNLGGHAFVCDGYDGNGLFHFNFGWDGKYDGYFTLNDPYGFSSRQSIIHNIFPIEDIPIQSDAHGIIYVSPDGKGDGSSWKHATSELQLAIFKCHINNHTIWVKEGTYYGTPSDEYAFRLLRNCKIYGGFKGDEPFDYDLSLRDFEAHLSILDGNNKQGVINVSPYFDSYSTIIDGFTIQHGQATKGSGIILNSHAHVRNCKICSNTAQYGGGITQHPTMNQEDIIIEDCEIFNNEAQNGGGIYDRGCFTIRRCWIHDNHASSRGGGIRISGNEKQSQYIHCTISNNTAQSFGGGLSSNNNSKSSFWSCLINNNTALKGGGASLTGEDNLFNCTIVKNEALSEYGGIYTYTNTKSQSEIKNCIIWGNVSPDGNTQIGPSRSYHLCAVQNDKTTNNFNAAAENDGEVPSFYVRFKSPCDSAGINGHGGDWQLQSTSNCIDMVKMIKAQPDTDLIGNPRLRHNNVDLGAYESDVVANKVTEYICDDEPFYYGDLLITAPGYYTFPYPGLPYDSLVILQVSKGQYSHNIIQSKSICEGDVYAFYGTLLQETGHYVTVIACDSILLDLTVHPLPDLRCNNDTVVDYGFPVFLSASGADSYLWSTGDTTSSITVFPEEDITYKVTGFMRNGCSDETSVTVRVNKNNDNIVLYPNPANDKVTINLFEIDEVDVFNLMGEHVAHIDANRDVVVLDVSTYPSGLYIIQVSQLSNCHYKKLVIRH